MSGCKVVAICNQKGGVTKTTTTVNLGIGLAIHGKKYFDLLPSSIELSGMEMTLVNAMNREFTLKEFLFALQLRQLIGKRRTAGICDDKNID